MATCVEIVFEQFPHCQMMRVNRDFIPFAPLDF